MTSFKKRHLIISINYCYFFLVKYMQYQRQNLLHLSLNTYFPLILQQQQKACELFDCRSLSQTDSQATIGYFHLSAIVYEYVLLEIKEQESQCNQYLQRLFETMHKMFDLDQKRFCKIVYKIYFYRQLNKFFDQFVEQIKIQLAKIRYNIEQQPLETVEQQSIDDAEVCESKLINDAQTTFDRSKQMHQIQNTTFQLPQFTFDQDQEEIVYEDLDIEDEYFINNFQRKLNDFCDESSASSNQIIQIKDDVSEYLNQVGNPRSQMTELCHQIGLNNPSISKTQNNKIFTVGCRLVITSKYTGQKQTIYEEYAEDKNSKVATTEATKKVLHKIYFNHNDLWEDFKGVKKLKKIRT